MQTQAARLVCNLQKRDHVKPALSKLHWLLIAHKVDFKTLCLVFKVHRRLEPEYLSSMTPHNSTARSLRSETQLWVETTRYKLGSIGGRRLQSSGARLWNYLPIEIWAAKTLLSFRKQIKTWQFSRNAIM